MYASRQHVIIDYLAFSLFFLLLRLLNPRSLTHGTNPIQIPPKNSQAASLCLKSFPASCPPPPPLPASPQPCLSNTILRCVLRPSSGFSLSNPCVWFPSLPPSFFFSLLYSHLFMVAFFHVFSYFFISFIKQQKMHLFPPSFHQFFCSLSQTVNFSPACHLLLLYPPGWHFLHYRNATKHKNPLPHRANLCRTAPKSGERAHAFFLRSLHQAHVCPELSRTHSRLVLLHISAIGVCLVWLLCVCVLCFSILPYSLLYPPPRPANAKRLTPPFCPSSSLLYLSVPTFHSCLAFARLVDCFMRFVRLIFHKGANTIPKNTLKTGRDSTLSPALSFPFFPVSLAIHAGKNTVLLV